VRLASGGIGHARHHAGRRAEVLGPAKAAEVPACDAQGEGRLRPHAGQLLLECVDLGLTVLATSCAVRAPREVNTRFRLG
jgi:hypothetical protein